MFSFILGNIGETVESRSFSPSVTIAINKFNFVNSTALSSISTPNIDFDNIIFLDFVVSIYLLCLSEKTINPSFFSFLIVSSDVDDEFNCSSEIFIINLKD